MQSRIKSRPRKACERGRGGKTLLRLELVAPVVVDRNGLSGLAAESRMRENLRSLGGCMNERF